MKRRAAALILLLLLVFLCRIPVCAAQDALQETADETGDALFSLLDDETAEIVSAFGADGFSPDRVFDVSWDAIRAFFSDTLRDVLQGQGRSFALSLALLLLIACLKSLLRGDGTDAAFDLLSLCAVTTQLAVSMHTFVSAAAAALQTAGTFMQGFIPVYAGLLAFSGHAGAALSYQTLCFALAQGISAFASRLCVPLLGLFFCLAIAFSCSETVRAPAFLSAVNKGAALLLGLFSGVFTGVLSIRQVLFRAADSAALKGARFLVSSLIPVVGSAMSDAYSAVLCSIDLIKGSAVVFAFLVLLAVHLPVVLTLLLSCLSCGALKTAASLFGEGKLSVLYQSFETGVRLLLLLNVFECFLLLITTGLTLQLRQ